ncbi:MAG: hypothetical protein EA381_09115 [Planctomycetaceae bacterium]|nr:MAG: hypothetical protein EA381_09115 [Planctomycetaceae bacterium]
MDIITSVVRMWRGPAGLGQGVVRSERSSMVTLAFTAGILFGPDLVGGRLEIVAAVMVGVNRGFRRAGAA